MWSEGEWYGETRVGARTAAWWLLAGLSDAEVLHGLVAGERLTEIEAYLALEQARRRLPYDLALVAVA
jgi:hypothetical protein